MGKNKEQFCKFHRAPGHNTEDCLVLKNIVQDAVDKEIIKEVSEQPDILKNPFPKHGKGIISMVRLSTNHPMMVTNKRDTASLDFFGLLLKHDKGSINAQTGSVKQDRLIEIDQKLQVWDPEPLGFIFNELDPLPEVKKGGFSSNRGNEWALELCENSSIIFSDKDLPTEGASHNDALHIVVETRGTRVSHNEKGLDLLIRHGYRPFTGLGKYENGILEPITLTGQRGTQALGCQSYEKVDVEEEIKSVPFVKSNTIGGCSPSI
ncbi:hypothetical protein EJ110_NYTH32506 [Nymphaea thermarum]|nr:hypothetical protein EJ110_NYTH32506 [Nymphaea thermarum]